MKHAINSHGVSLWLSSSETASWARRPGAAWPCSYLAGRRLFAQFDRNGLCDLSIDGGRGGQDVPGDELSAICADHLAAVVPVDHAVEFVAVRQHLSGRERTRRDVEERALRAAGLHRCQTGRRAASVPAWLTLAVDLFCRS